MRIRAEHNGTIFEYECRLMPERCFKALCALAAAGAGMVRAVATLCGVPGMLTVAVVTVLVAMIAKGMG